MFLNKIGCMASQFLPKLFRQDLSFQLKAHTKVQAPDLFITGQFFRRSCLQNTAIVHQIGPVSDGQSFLHIVVSDEDADVAGL